MTSLPPIWTDGHYVITDAEQIRPGFLRLTVTDRSLRRFHVTVAKRFTTSDDVWAIIRRHDNVKKLGRRVVE